MGWHHALQMVEGEIPSANLTDVAELWFLGGGGQPGRQPAALVKEWEPKGVKFHASVSSVAAPPLKAKGGAHLRPYGGQPEAAEGGHRRGLHLRVSRSSARPPCRSSRRWRASLSKGIPVYMGYNKNVTKYVTDALAGRRPPGLGLDGTLPQQCVPEEGAARVLRAQRRGHAQEHGRARFALLVTYYGVKGDNIKTVTPDKAYSCARR